MRYLYILFGFSVFLVNSHWSLTLVSAAPIANHTVIDQFPALTQEQLRSASSQKTLFMHQSTGMYIDFTGLQCLAGLKTGADYPPECHTYAQHPYNPYDNRNWDWNIWDDTSANALTKTDQWVSVVNSLQENYQVLGMKYCYVDSWNLDFPYYLQAMTTLEQLYPTKKFIWTTVVLVSEDLVGQDPNANKRQLFNQDVRAYATAHNKVLLDLADIESHDVNGAICQAFGYESLCAEYYMDGGGHPNIPASIRLAKGFWWLMANLDSTPQPSSPPPPTFDFIDFWERVLSFGTNNPGLNLLGTDLIDIFDVNYLFRQL